MNKEIIILKLTEENDGIITSSLIDKLNIPRFYLSKLVNEGKLKRIERGIYSFNDIKVDNFFNLQLKSNMIIYSHFTALNLHKFYKDIDLKPQISVYQGYNAFKFDNFKVFYDSKDIYNDGLVEVINEFGNKIKVYCIERCICDIIKHKNRFKIDEVNKFLNFYFTHAVIDYQKLLYYSKLVKVSSKVQHYLSLFKA